VAHADHELIIRRPSEVVFAYLADGENNPNWRGGILRVARTSDQAGLGATYRQVVAGPRGRQVRHDYRVVTYDPPTRLEFQHLLGLARPAGRFQLTAVEPDRTLVRFELDWQPTGLRKVLNNMIERWMTDEVARLDELQRLLHEPAGPG
jgi:uncharacterized protein YndB with AHSA1/START domain